MRKQTNGKMKKIKYILGCIGTALMFSACSDFLDVATQNGLDPDQANDAERFCNAAYASLMNQRDVKLWAWGDVRSDDAYKGGGGTNDGYTEHCYETGTHIVFPPQSSATSPYSTSSCFTLSGLAEGLSILFMATITSTPAAFAWFMASMVWGITPSSAATTRTAISVICAPLIRMAVNASWPGVSRKVMGFPFIWTV